MENFDILGNKFNWKETNNDCGSFYNALIRYTAQAASAAVFLPAPPNRRGVGRRQRGNLRRGIEQAAELIGRTFLASNSACKNRRRSDTERRQFL
jgi:hypothetical protein